VLGAHLDHLGRGKHSNSLARKGETSQIHLGADDNASGVAAVLEVGARLARQERPVPVALAFWSGEELGLLGSTAFLNEGPVPPDGISAYVNFDMVGRMRENRISLQAVGSSSIWPRLIERSNVVVGFDVQLRQDPYLPTDAIAFYQAKVPVLDFFTGSHDDYHRPTDSSAKINYEDMQRVVELATLMVGKLEALPERPDYVEVKPDLERSPARGTVRAFTGTIPDYTTEVDGLRLSGVIEGGPADNAGLREGDVIVEFAGQKIANIYDYTFALEIAKIDKPVEVVILRDGQRTTVTLTPTARK
jgi:Iap family predicted aminopeptidase